MDQYRTSGVMDEAAIKETAKLFIPRWYLWSTRISCVFFFLMSLLFALAGKKYGYAAFFLLVSVMMASYPAIHRRRYAKVNFTRLTEQAGSSSLRVESFFNVDGLAVLNLDAETAILLRYDDIAFLSETKHYFAVMTKGQQFSIIFKDCLTDEQERSFRSDLKQHCPKLKIRR